MAAIGGSWRSFAYALIATLVVAEIAALAFSSSHDLLPVDAVDLGRYFSAAELERIRDFRRPQIAIYAASLAIEIGLLVWLVRHAPQWLLSRRTATSAVAIALILTVGGLPLAIVSRLRSLNVGLSTRSWSGWALDTLMSAAIDAIMAAIIAVLFFTLIRKFTKYWWIIGSGLVVAIAVIVVYIWPVVHDPLFNRFDPVRSRETRADVLELSRLSGVDVDKIYVIDASRRTTAANAYIGGLGKTKRVVFYDNLLRSFSRDEIRFVVAHELAHIRHNDLLNGIIYVALVAPFGVYAVSRLRPRTVAALWLAIVLVVTPVTWVSNQMSRSVEARADSDALRITGNGLALVSFQRKIVTGNLSDPQPPKLTHMLLGTHPTAAQRIGMGLASERAK